MNKKILAICDGEDRYARGLMEYMSDKENLPFSIYVYTDINRFKDHMPKDDIECLLISERIYNSDIETLNIPHVIILSESGSILNNTLHHINKYQSCENIYKEVLEYYTKESEEAPRKLRITNRSMKIIGVYTPIGRSLQTTFAITLGQMLSKEHKTLYMNFERYSGLSILLKRSFSSDISDLMYYLECAKEKLAYKVDSIVENVNGLDFIPPAEIFQNIAGIKKDQWADLFLEMEKCTEYEYLILDLTDGMVDLWGILENCEIVYTITKGDSIALAKMNQYETLLRDTDNADILAKTRKCRFPAFRNLPQKLDEFTIGDMARYVKENILSDISGLDQ